MNNLEDAVPSDSGRKYIHPTCRSCSRLFFGEKHQMTCDECEKAEKKEMKELNLTIAACREALLRSVNLIPTGKVSGSSFSWVVTNGYTGEEISSGDDFDTAYWKALSVRFPIIEGEHIEAAAVKFDGTILALPRPNRHHHVFREYYRHHSTDMPTESLDQGFITSRGRFVDRTEGLVIADRHGQIVKKHPTFSELFSEDMW